MRVQKNNMQSFGSVNGFVSLTTYMPLQSMKTRNAANNALQKLSDIGDGIFNINVEAEFKPESTNKKPILTGNLLVSGYKKESLTLWQSVKSLFISHQFYEPKNVRTIIVKAIENSDIMENSIFYAGLDIIRQLSHR